MPRPAEVSRDLAQEIVTQGCALGIAAIDTAPSYGTAEDTVACLRLRLPLQTKVRGQAGGIREQVQASSARSNVSRFDTILVHDWRLLSRRQRVETAQALQDLKEEGQVDRIGPSCYAPEELADALSIFRSPFTAQVPVNILDQRLEQGALAQQAAEEGCVLQARSVFLQGLLLGANELAIRWLHPDLSRLVDLGFRNRAAAMAMCLSFVRSRPWVAEIVIGANDLRQLLEICQAAQVSTASASRIDWQQLASSDQDLIDPTRW